MKHMHRILSLLTAGAMLLGVSAVPVSAAVLPGDIDGSGEVALRDAVLLAKAAAGAGETLSAEARTAADVNGDGSIDTGDITVLLQYLAGLRDSLSGTADSAYLAAKELTAGILSGTVETKAPDAQFIAAQRGFAASLLQNEWALHENENVLVSPLSVTLALAMTANGAKGDTLAEMEALLGDELTIGDLNAYCRGWIDTLPQSERASLAIANSVWFDEHRISVPQPFLQTTADYYKASAFRAAFDDPRTVTDLNAWVSRSTHDMIPKLLDRIPPDTVMILMNALAFEAEWMQPYDKYSVGERTFTAADGTAETAEMMWSEEHTYLKTPHAVGFIKPYMGGYSFAAILPNEDISLSSYLADFDAAEYTALIESQKYAPVQAALPKFSYDFSDSLLKSLKAMGMVTAFDGGAADLSGLTENPAQALFISDVIHKTHIEVGEKGTRAGAVTAVLVNETAVMDPPEEVILDRPFLYAIIDNETQLPIFIGTVTSLEE